MSETNPNPEAAPEAPAISTEPAGPTPTDLVGSDHGSILQTVTGEFEKIVHEFAEDGTTFIGWHKEPVEQDGTPKPRVDPTPPSDEAQANPTQAEPTPDAAPDATAEPAADTSAPEATPPEAAPAEGAPAPEATA